MFFARKRVSAPPDIFSSWLPKTLMVPLSTRSVPAMALSRVVFPQPDGPTNIMISPVRAWRFTCLSTWMRSGPSPKLFSTARTSTTVWWDGGESGTEDHGGFVKTEADDAHQRGEHADDLHGEKGADRDLPGHVERRLAVLDGPHGESRGG